MSQYHYDPTTGIYTSAIPHGTHAAREVLAEYLGIERTEVIRDKSRCATQNSEHCECRGIDYFTSELNRRIIFHFAMTHPELGFQSVIADRRVWGFGDPTERQYNGPNPHTDHVHVGLTIAASKTLTRAMLVEAINPAPEEEDHMIVIVYTQGKPERYIRSPVDGTKRLIGGAGAQNWYDALRKTPYIEIPLSAKELNDIPTVQ